MVAQPDDATHNVKPDKAGTITGAPDLGFDRMQPQAQCSQLLLDSQPGPLQRFGVIGKQGAIIDITQIGANSCKSSNCMIEIIQMKIGQILASEVADWEAPRPFQWRE